MTGQTICVTVGLGKIGKLVAGGLQVFQGQIHAYRMHICGNIGGDDMPAFAAAKVQYEITRL